MTQNPFTKAHPSQAFAWFSWSVCLLFIFFLNLVESMIWYERSPLYQLAHPVLSRYVLAVVPYLLSMFFFQVPVGAFIDLFGPRKMVSLVMLISAIGVLLIGLSTSLSGISIIALFIVGIGGTVTYVSAFKMASNWFLPHRFPSLAGWTFLISFLGSAIGVKFSGMILSHFSWKLTVTNLGLIGMIYGIFFFLVLRDSAPGANYDVHTKRSDDSIKEALKKALLSWENWSLALAIGLIQGHRIPLVGINIPIFSCIYGGKAQKLNQINVYELILFVIGTWFFCMLSKYIKRRKLVIVIGTIISAVIYLIPIYTSIVPSSMLAISYSVSAFFAGSTLLIFILMHEKNVPQVTATVIGMLVMLICLFHLLTALFTDLFLNAEGMIKTGHFTQQESFIYLLMIPVCIIVGLSLLFFVKETYGKQKL